MIPVYLRLSGFLSYQQPVELDFSTFDLACISGANGAGKSTLLDAISWGIFGEARRKDDAIINAHTDTAEVRLDFEYEGNLYRVQRSKKRSKTTTLEFQIQDQAKKWQSLSEHSVRETEKKIQQTLRMDYDTFINASFFLQGKADLFAQQRPGERKRILTNILGLETWEIYRQNSLEKRKKLELESNGLEKILIEIINELNLGDQRKARLEQLEKELGQAEIIRAAKEKELENLHRLSASLNEQKNLVDILAQQTSNLKKRKETLEKDFLARKTDQLTYQHQLDSAEEIQTGYQDLQKLRLDLEKWDGIARNFQDQEKQRAKPLMEIEKERSRLQEAKKNLDDQKKKMEDQQNELPELQSSLNTIQSQINLNKKKIEELKNLRKELDQFQDTEAHALAENLKLKSEMQELKNRIDQLKNTEGALCPLCGQLLETNERLNLISELEIKGKTMGDHFRENQAFLQNMKTQKKEIEKRLSEMDKKENLQRNLQREFDQNANKIDTLQKTLTSWQIDAEKLEAINLSLQNEDFAIGAYKTLAAADAALKKIGYDSAAHDEVRRNEMKARIFESKMRELEVARGALEPLAREISNLKESIQALEQEIIEQEGIYKKAEDKYLMDAAAIPDINLEEKQLYTLQEQENQLRMQVGGAVQEVKVLDTLQVRKDTLEEEQKVLSHKISQYGILERAFSKDGIPALLIEQALPEIELQANEILDKLTNGGMSVRFQTQRDYKDKKRQDKKETLDILISDSAGVRAYELFSGGEAFRVNFAIRLALSRVLAQRAGARLQTLVIDEGFGSQDSEGRQRLVEAINLVRKDFSKILVITHLDELKEAFTTRIEVSKELQGSQIQVVA
ncbi:MAG: SMC family ATPase [Anaerolineaceae bacterium]|nr:SMC family ATPase [Anaerolineaceae bacterium]